MNAEAEPRVFTTTRWSLVLAGANTDGDQQQAAAKRWRNFAEPIGDRFFRLCRRGYSTEDAQDITQDFFLMILKTNWLRQADQGRGRFRSLLLKSVQNFLHNVSDTKQTLKRGGGVEFVTVGCLDGGSAVAVIFLLRAPLTLSHPNDFSIFAGPQRSSTTRFGVCERSAKVRDACGCLKHCGITSQQNTPTSRMQSRCLGVAETIIKKQLHNLRQRYRWLLRDEVAHTVGSPADVDDEIRHLCAALAAAA